MIMTAKEKKVRKQIDLSEGVKIRLQVLAAKENKDLKNYIQDILTEHAAEPKPTE